MNSMVPPQTSTPVMEISQLLFSMFVYVADVEKDITAQEVRRFQALIKETSWVREGDIRGSLETLRNNYSAFWGVYEDNKLNADTDTIAATLAEIELAIGPDRAHNFREDATKFLQRLEAGIYGVKLIQGEQKAKADARLALAKMLRPTGEKKRDLKQITNRLSEPPVVTAPGVSAEPQNAKPAEPTKAKSTCPAPDSGSAAAGAMQVWKQGKTPVRCVSVIQETHDCKTYSFEAQTKTLFHYDAGQFVTIEVPMPGQTLRRSYTISSSPSRPYMLSITVKKVPMGWMSNWLFDNVEPGFECNIIGPSGHFSYANHPADKVLFLAAGSGITPCMSMLRWLADIPSTTDIVFINSVRTPVDIIFHQELMHLSTRLGPRLRLAVLPGEHSPGIPWNGPVGNLDAGLLRSFAPDFAEREVFTCGPPGYMNYVKGLLSSLDYPMERYHDESFGGGAVASAPAAKAVAPQGRAPVPAARVPASAPAPVKAAPAAPAAKSPVARAPAPDETASVPARKSSPKVSIEATGDSFSVREDQTILEAAEEAGVMLESSCRAGVCGMCKMRTVSGSVNMPESPVLSEDERASGMILTCMGKTCGDLVLAT